MRGGAHPQRPGGVGGGGRAGRVRSRGPARGHVRGAGREVLALRQLGYDAVGYEPNARLVAAGRAVLAAEGHPDCLFASAPDRFPTDEPAEGVVIGWGSFTLIQGAERRRRLLQGARAVLPAGAPMLVSYFLRPPVSYFRVVTAVGRPLRRLRGGEPSSSGTGCHPTTSTTSRARRWTACCARRASRRSATSRSPTPTPSPARSETVALPTFFVIGAAKAGTTSLHGYLDRHPQVQMSAVKEPRFFVADADDEVASSGRVADRDAYEALFDPAAAHRGESSTSYSLFPLYRAIPARIRAAVPGARFVYVVRDPVERAVSHYQQAFFAGTAFEAVERRVRRAGRAGAPLRVRQPLRHPARAVPRVLRRDRLRVVDSARLAADPHAVVREVVAFLGADPALLPADLGAPQNRTEGKRVATGSLARLRRSGLAGRVPAPVRRPARAAARVLLSRSAPPPTPSPAALERLRAHLGPEADRLRALTGQAYETWTV